MLSTRAKAQAFLERTGGLRMCQLHVAMNPGIIGSMTSTVEHGYRMPRKSCRGGQQGITEAGDDTWPATLANSSASREGLW
jgi:hypothetical protein